MNNHSALPSDFLWGAATSAFQTEGSPSADGEPSVWNADVAAPHRKSEGRAEWLFIDRLRSHGGQRNGKGPSGDRNVSLDRSGSHASDHELLQQQESDDDRHTHGERGCHDLVPIHVVLRRVPAQTDGKRSSRV